MIIVDLIADFLWGSTEWLGLDFSNMSRRRMIVATILWSISDLLFIGGGLLFIFGKNPVFEETTLNLIVGTALFFFGGIQLVYVCLQWRAAILKNQK